MNQMNRTTHCASHLVHLVHRVIIKNISYLKRRMSSWGRLRLGMSRPPKQKWLYLHHHFKQ